MTTYDNIGSFDTEAEHSWDLRVRDAVVWPLQRNLFTPNALLASPPAILALRKGPRNVSCFKFISILSSPLVILVLVSCFPSLAYICS